MNSERPSPQVYTLCPRCGLILHEPRVNCPRCHSTDLVTVRDSWTRPDDGGQDASR